MKRALSTRGMRDKHKRECFNIGAGAEITLVKDGAEIIGIYFIPPKGGWEWHCGNGDWGDATSEDECVAKIRREV